MSDTEDAVENTAAAAKTPKSPKAGATLTTKKIKRRMEKIGGNPEPRQLRNKSNKLATAILRQIAEGTISNPVAAAKAFLKANPKAAGSATGSAVDDTDDDTDDDAVE